MSALSPNAFADVHKVEGLRGIYIASVVVPKANKSAHAFPFWAPVALGWRDLEGIEWMTDRLIYVEMEEKKSE